MIRELDWHCTECDFSLYLPIATTSLIASHLGLYTEGRFPGRCILALDQHKQHLEDLSSTEVQVFWSDATRVGCALKRIVGASRVNYAVLGNVPPHHMHIHIIPRIPSREPLPTRSPWNDPRELVEVSLDASSRFRKTIAEAIDSASLE